MAGRRLRCPIKAPGTPHNRYAAAWWATRGPTAQERSIIHLPWILSGCGSHSLGRGSFAQVLPRLAVALIARAWWPARAASAAIRSGCRPVVPARRRGRPAAARQAAVLAWLRANSTSGAGRCTRQMGATELTTRRLGARSGPRAMPAAMFPPAPPPPARIDGAALFPLPLAAAP